MNSAAIILFFNLIFFMARWQVRATDSEDLIESPEPLRPCVNLVTGESTGPDTEAIITEYYDSGTYAGCVKQQLVKIADDYLPINRFIYHQDHTEVIDSQHNKSIYRFSQDALISDIENFDSQGNLVSTEHLDWEAGMDKPLLKCKVLKDAQGKVVLAEVHEKDAEGNRAVQVSVQAQKLLNLYEKVDAFITQNCVFPSKELPTLIELGEIFFGKMYTLMLGLYDQPMQTGVVGKGEVSNRVRVTFINGILNSCEDCRENAEFLSGWHGGVNVHYIYRPTEGWSEDMISSTLVKLGYVTPQACEMVKLWRQLIAEMGGPGNGGTIIHYAHSIGGSETWNAKNMLTTEEKKMIHVITIGSPSMIHKNGLYSVDNYVSVRDGVCLLDPVGYIRGRLHNDARVVFVGSWIGMPIVDHQLNSETYQKVIQELGKKFVENYGAAQP